MLYIPDLKCAAKLCREGGLLLPRQEALPKAVCPVGNGGTHYRETTKDGVFRKYRITPPSQTTETTFCLDLAELCILTDNLPTDLHLPLLSLGGYSSVLVCVSYSHDYQDPDFAHDYHVEFAAQAIHQRKFKLSHGWTEEGPPPLAEQIITYLKRFLLCYQQFHQLHAHFAFFEQVPHPLPLYTCTWSFPSVPLQHHLLRWSLSGNHSFSYQNTHTHEAFAGAPYFHTSHVPPFHPDLITQTLQKLTPFLEKIQLELYTC